MNNTFVSVTDLQENSSYGEQKAMKEELFSMQQAIKQHMDTGLSAEDMHVAKAARNAVLAADDIFDKLFN